MRGNGAYVIVAQATASVSGQYPASSGFGTTTSHHLELLSRKAYFKHPTKLSFSSREATQLLPYFERQPQSAKISFVPELQNVTPGRCTRWYLPLVLLPMPVAPPYFLLLFLFSTTMHARPCFYCIVLLTAMFMSTCYWPPIPIQTPLVRPWAENVTTFADALHLMMPNLPEEKVPTIMPVADRCWCDLSNGFFASFNTTKWEEQSVVRLKDRLEKEMAAEEEENERRECEKGEGEDVADSSACAEILERHQANATTTAIAFPESYFDRRPYIWDMFRAFKFASTPSIVNVSSTEDDTNTSPASASTPDASDSSMSDAKKTAVAFRSTTPQPWLRREYDLRQFGFAMVLDFGWPASHS